MVDGSWEAEVLRSDIYDNDSLYNHKTKSAKYLDSSRSDTSAT